MVSIKRISVSSAMKVGALLYALTFTVFGILFFAMQSFFLNAISTSISQSASQSGTQFSSSGLMAGGLAAFCIFYVGGVIFAAISGGIGGAVMAFLYNLVANWVGGIEIELSSMGTEKPKRDSIVGDSSASF